MCAVGCITEHPISSTNHELTNEGFDVIIVDSNITMFDTSFKQMLMVCSVSERFAEFAFWRNIFSVFVNSFKKVFHSWCCVSATIRGSFGSTHFSGFFLNFIKQRNFFNCRFRKRASRFCSNTHGFIELSTSVRTAAKMNQLILLCYGSIRLIAVSHYFTFESIQKLCCSFRRTPGMVFK